MRQRQRTIFAKFSSDYVSEKFRFDLLNDKINNNGKVLASKSSESFCMSVSLHIREQKKIECHTFESIAIVWKLDEGVR